MQIREWNAHLRQTVAAVDVDAAIAEGKVAPEQRSLALAAAERDPLGFREAMASTPQIFELPLSPDEQRRAAALATFQTRVAEKRRADPELDLGTAMSQVAREDPSLYRAVRGQA
jgi:hypothetical protein